MGRVGLVSLGQIAILALGAWVAARLDYGTSMPVPDRDAHRRPDHDGARDDGRPARAAPQRPVPRAHHADARGRDHRGPDRDELPQRRPRVPRPHRVGDGQHRDPPTCDRRERPGLLPLHGRRRRGDVPARALAHPLQAGPRLGRDPPERARRARRGREHHALQALGLRARVVHDRRRRRPARGERRQALHLPVPDPRLDHPARGVPDGRHLQLVGRGHRGHLHEAPARPCSTASTCRRTC